MTKADYLVEMKLAPASTISSPAEGVAFAERFVLPTFDACRQLAAAGKIVAGGPKVGAMAFVFILRVDSPQEADDIVAGLPLWPRSQTTVVPLGSFESRERRVRERVAAAKASLPAAPDRPAANALERSLAN